MRDFNSQLSPTDSSVRDKINREMGLTGINQMYLTDIYQTFHPNTKDYTLFLVTHGTFSKIEPFLRTQNKSQQITRK